MTTTNLQNYEELSGQISELLKPYQREANRRQRSVDFILRCVRAAERGDFFQIHEMLQSSQCKKIVEDPELMESKVLFEQLLQSAENDVSRYRIDFVSDLQQLADDAGLALDIDFPRLGVLKGIEGIVNFTDRKTEINGKVLKSVSPKRIVAALSRIKRALYDRPFEAQTFIDNMYMIYRTILERQNGAIGDTLPIQPFYREYVLSLQSKTFFLDMARNRFKGYSLDMFAVDIWKYFQSDIESTSDGNILQLRPGRNNALWLIDSDGEKRRITRIAFQRGE